MDKIKLIAIDMDGTLLDSRCVVRDISRKTVEDAVAAGYTVTISTGRSFRNARYGMLREVNTIPYYVTANGSVAVDAKTEEIIYKKGFSNDTVEKILELARDREVYVEAYAGTAAYIEQRGIDLLYEFGISDEFCERATSENYIFDEIEPELAKAEYPVSKINIIFKGQEEMEEVLKQVETIPDINPVPLRGPWYSIEVTPANVSKKAALSFLCEKLGIKQEEVMAIGDSNNDYEMLAWAGLSVAMGNAANHIKELADHVTEDHDHDGAAKAIQRILEKKDFN